MGLLEWIQIRYQDTAFRWGMKRISVDSNSEKNEIPQALKKPPHYRNPVQEYAKNGYPFLVGYLSSMRPSR
jgi:hypothetical protein